MWLRLGLSCEVTLTEGPSPQEMQQLNVPGAHRIEKVSQLAVVLILITKGNDGSQCIFFRRCEGIGVGIASFAAILASNSFWY